MMMSSAALMVVLDLTRRHREAMRFGDEELRTRLFNLIDELEELYPEVRDELEELYPQKGI